MSPGSVLGFRADRGYSYAAIEFEAVVMRERLDPTLQAHERLRGIELFERLHEYNVRVGSREIPFDYAVKNLPRGPEAFALYDQEDEKIVVTLSEDTYRALERDHRRARFTFLHEVGHALLHASLLQRLSLIPHRVAALQRGEWSDHPRYFDTEWQANAFAAAMLMPARGLAELERRGLLDVQTIVTLFTTSPAAAETRIKVYRDHKEALLAAG